MRFRRTTIAVFWSTIAVGMIAAPAPAFAQDKPAKGSAAASSKAQASDLFKKGADAYMRGDFQASIDFLDQAYALDPQPVMIYNKARAQEGLGKTDEAIALYEQYLNQDPNTPDRGAIEQRLTTLKKQRDEKAALQKSQADAEKERAERAAHPPPPPHKRSSLPYVVAGVGIAGIGTGVVFGVLAKSKESDGNGAKTQKDAIDSRDTGSTFATVANVAFIAGGVLVAAGAVWWALDRPSRSQVAILPNGVFGTF